MNFASLWLDVDTPSIAPPVVTSEQSLPLGLLTWENFERLCFRLAHRDGDVEDVRIYGNRGQRQEGIDLYVRRAKGDYETWQCKRYQSITATDIEMAVTKFLEGGWAARSKTFRLAVAPSLNATNLANEIERQRTRCNALNVVLEPLDCDRLSIMLKGHPDLVDDFFGRAWVVAFNGPEAEMTLSGRKLTREQKLSARLFMRTLYATQFQTVDGGIPAVASTFRGAIKPIAVFDRYVEPEIEMVESVIEHGQRPELSQPDGVGSADNNTGAGDTQTSNVGFRRRDVRTTLKLSAGLAGSDRFLLLGDAGFGKSAALRVVIHSLLGEEARFPLITKTWGQRLPVLFPFGFLTRHFADNEAATIETALLSWLKGLGAKDEVLVLLEEMLSDERLLLMVDGLDEWQNREAAITALTALTTYAQTRHLPLLATGRPLGSDRITDLGPDWKRAELLPLTPPQQREFATYWFRHFHAINPTFDAAALDLAVARDATEFSSELSDDVDLAELGGVPLLLSVLIYLRLSGRVLPHSRLAAIEELVRALLDEQPRRRAQAAMQRVDQSSTRDTRIRRGIEYLGYCIHQEPNSLVLSNERAVQLLYGYFHDARELPASEAEEWANRVLELGQHEFGILVAPQENHVGLLHRILQEYLAAKYLSRLSLVQVKNYCADSGRKGSWHEVTLMLLQLLDRQDDVDMLIEELRTPVLDCLEEPRQQILLTRIGVAPINCSRGKARELISDVFSWIECGRWMPLRRALVREVATGLTSEQVSSLVATRVARWFPGRLRSLTGVAPASAKQPTNETISDLWIALHNCDSMYDYREIAEALATFSESSPELSDKFLAILKESAEVDLMAAALHAIANGWPTHPDLPALLEVASNSPAKNLQVVAILARFRQGERSTQVRGALLEFCKNRQWPWDKEIVGALASGWPHDPDLKSEALERIRGIGFPGSWDSQPAIEYALRGCPGDDDVAKMVAEHLEHGENFRGVFALSEIYEDLLTNFTQHPLLVPVAEAWLDRHADTFASPLDFAVIAKLAGTHKSKRALMGWLKRGEGMPAWIISTLLEMAKPSDRKVRRVLKDYIVDEGRRASAVRWLPEIVRDSDDLSGMLREVLNGVGTHDSCAALEIIVKREGREASNLWETVEAKLKSDTDGRYWRFANHTLLKIWPEHPLIRRLVISTIYSGDIYFPLLYEVYAYDSEIRPLMDGAMKVLHDDLRLELIRAIKPMVRSRVPVAIALAEEFVREPNGEIRTIASRAYAQSMAFHGCDVGKLAATLALGFDGFYIGSAERKQAIAAALLELGRADLLMTQLEGGSQLKLNTYLGGSHNWEFVSTIVEHWEELFAVMPDLWERFRHSPVIAIELARAGKGVHAMSQSQIFEDMIRESEQLEIENVRALIALHGRSLVLRDLFVGRLKYFLTGRKLSMRSIDMVAYHEMGKYIGDHFHGDEAVGQAMLEVSRSPMIGDVGLITLYRGWPDSPAIAETTKNLLASIWVSEPIKAWVFATKASSELMTAYVLQYPEMLRGDNFREVREGVAAVSARLRQDIDCRESVFAALKNVSNPDIVVAVTRLLAPAMGGDNSFRSWVADQLTAIRAYDGSLAPLAFDVLSNAAKPLKFAFLETMLTAK